MLTKRPTRRLLVVVDETCTSPWLCANVRGDADGERLEVFVLSPAHGTAATEWYVDEDAARADATRRLRACIGCLRGQGIKTRGEVAGPDPVQGIADALRIFPADEILIVTAPQRPATWLQRGVTDRARRTFTQPIKHVVMPATTERSTR
jgi:hypothetical protein